MWISFLKDARGNMGMMMALSLMMLMAGVGAAVDYSGMESNKSKFQDYADMAVLAAAVSGFEKPSELQKIAKSIVDQNNTSNVKLKTTLTILPDGTYHVDIIGKYDTMVMGMFNNKMAKISVVAEAPPAGTVSQKLNIALVLDITLSMQGTKIEALQVAATDLISSISGDVDGETMFSIIPYAQYVALDVDQYSSAPWLDIDPPESMCEMTINWGTSTGCSTETISYEKDGVTVVEDRTTCTNYDYFESCYVKEWRGCVSSRLPPWTSRDYYGGAKIPGMVDIWCDYHTPMLPLTTSVSAAKTLIADLEVDDDTYIPSGLMWGWRALTPTPPLTQANTADRESRTNVLVLMTDGENTQSAYNSSSKHTGYYYHTGDEPADADALTSSLCQQIKNSGIEVYTVAFQVSDATTLNMLRGCATDASKFYNATDATALKAAFADIGDSFAGGEVRLSR